MGFFDSLFGSKPKAFDIKAYNYHLFFDFIPKKLHEWEEKKISFDSVINFDSLVYNNKLWKSLVKDTKVISSGIKLLTKLGKEIPYLCLKFAPLLCPWSDKMTR